MSTVSVIAKIRDMKSTSFKFTSFERKMTTPDNTGERKILIVFELADMIDRVEGSTILHDPMDYNSTVNVFAEDVTQVSCMLDTIEKYEREFTFDVDANGELTKSGEYKGDLMLDVSSKRRDTWLTDTKLSKFGQDKRSEARQEQYKMFFTGKK